MSPARVIRIQQGARQVMTGRFDELLADDRRVWVTTFPRDSTTAFSVRAIAGQPTALRELPNSVFVAAAAGDWLIGSRSTTSGSGPDTGPLVLLLDAKTGVVRDDLGAGYPIAVGAGKLVW